MTEQFNGTVVAGSHDHSLEALLATDPVFGLHRESTYFFASLRDADGRMYSAMRRLCGPGGWPNRLFTRSSVATGRIDRHELPVRTAASGTISATLGTDGALFTSAPTVDTEPFTEPFTATVTAGGLHWAEGAALELAGDDISQGLQWHLQATHGDELYVSRLFQVHGRFHDTPVRGVAGVDQVFLDQGRQNYVDDPITAGHLSLAWCTWANRYDDGTAESGHFAFGPGTFAFAVRSSSDGQVQIGTRITGAVELDGGSPDRARFEVDGEVWEYTVDTHGRCNPLGGPVLQSEGCLRRVGDPRTPVVWSASIEVPA